MRAETTMTVQRHFLGWHSPVVELAVARLTGSWESGTLDLSELLIVVPTTQSGRRLRRALALHANRRCSALLPPQTVTPDFFLHSGSASPPVASMAQALASWVRALMSLDIGRLSALFPIEPLSQDEPRWALDIAGKLSGLRRLLADSGLSIADVASRGLEAVEEPHRWNDMAKLERAYLKALKDAGLDDALVSEIRTARAPVVPDHALRLIVIAVPDPTPLAAQALERISETIPVEIWIHAPADKKDMFDEWGRPRPEAWESAQIALAGEDAIRLRGNAESQAAEVVTILSQRGEVMQSSQFAVCAPNPALVPFLEKAFADNDIAVYDAAGEGVFGHCMPQLISSLKEFVVARNYESLAALLRNPALLHALSRDHGSFDTSGLLQEMDEFQNEHLADSLDDMAVFLSNDAAGRYRHLKEALELAGAWARRFEDTPPARFVREFLAFVYRGSCVETGRGGDREVEIAGTVDSVLREMEHAIFDVRALERRVQMEILVDELRHSNIYPHHPPDAVPIQGWLEMPWEEAPLVVISGMDEGFVPASVVGDVFLPDVPRERLGVKSNRTRFARDAYLFAALIASRQRGDVCCVVGKTDVLGDPLKPSRLLFLCSDEDLARRARHLFSEPDDAPRGILQPRYQFRLRPPVYPPPDHVRVTDFKAYLQCPFRYYLRTVVGMESRDDRKVEADALDFGNACHRPLELLGKSRELAKCTDEHVLRAFLHAEAERFVGEKFGRDLSLTLTVQLESLKERLAKVAAIEAQQRKDGWEIVATEYMLGNGEGAVLNGMRVRGKIDRIDRRGDVVRILDYKTSDSAAEPQAAHVGNAPAAAYEWARFESEGKAKMWLDLQLALYRVFLERDPAFTNAEIKCGYFNIPKAVAKTGISLWEGLDRMQLDAAVRCAETIIDNMRNGVFWPPAAKVDYDGFENLYIHTLADAIDSEYFETAMRARGDRSG